MDDNMKKLVTYAMLGSIVRKIQVLSGIDDYAQNVFNPEYPKPSRAEIKAAARKNFKRTMHDLHKGRK